MADNQIRIVVTASGAAEAAKVLADVAKSGAQLGNVTATGAKQAEQALGHFGVSVQNVSGLMAQAGINTGIMGQAIGALTSPLGLASAAFVSFGLIVKQALGSMAEQAREIRQLQAVTGLGVEATDNLADTFKLLGYESGALTSSLFKLSQEIENGGQTLRLLGLSVRDSSGALKVEGDLFLEIRDRIAAMGSAAQRNATIMELFGRAGRELAPIFALSRAEFMKWRDEASKLSGWTEESQKAAQEYNIAVSKLGLAWGDFWTQTGTAMAGPATAVLTFLTSAIQLTKEWTAALQERVKAGEQLGGLQLPISPTGGEPFGGEPGAGPGGTGGGGGSMISLTAMKALEDYRKQLEVLRAAQLDQPIVKINQALDDFAAKFGPAAAAQMRPLVNEMIGLERAKQSEAALRALNDSMAGLATTMATFATQTTLFPLTEEQQQLATFNAAVDQARTKLLDLKEVLSPDEWRRRLTVFDAGAESLKRWAVSLTEAQTALREARQFYADLKEQWDAGAKSIEAMEFSHEKWLASLNANGALDEANAFYTALPGKIDAAKTRYESIQTPLDDAARSSLAFQQSLAGIHREAALVGPDFDLASAQLALFQRRILELQAIENPTGDVLAEIDQLKARFADTREFIQWRDMFQDVFSSVGGAINTLVQGVILGTQTMGEAFKKLGQSIVIEFVNRVIQQALNPLMKAAAAVVAGLFAPGSSAAGGGAGSSGDIDFGGGGAQAVADAAGGLTKAMQFANTATTGFGTSISSIGSGLVGIAGGSGGALGPAFTGVGAIDVAAAGGSLTDIGAAAGAAIGPISAMSVGLAGVGAAVAAFGTIMDFVNGKTEAAIGGVVGAVSGAVAGGVIGSFISPGAGTILGALAGGALGDWLGSMLGGLFGGGPSNYALKRAKAADEANAYLGGATQGYQSALETRSTAQILAALQSTGTGVNPLRTELVLTSNVAAQLGITGQREGDTIIARWTDVNEAQMNELIALFKLNPEMVPGAVRGAGDVGYLAQDKAHEFSAQLELGAEALLTAFTGLGAVTDKINQVARDLTGAAQEALPPSLAQEFADGIVNPIRDRMLAVINSGLPVKEMQKQLDTINTELQGKVEAWNMFAVAIKQATVVDALIPADLHEKFRAVMEPAYDDMLNVMRNGTAQQAALAADHFAKQTQAWAAFADAVQAQVGVEMLLEPIADLGDRFTAAMQPVYDKILASLVAGNGAIALAQAQTFAKLTQSWAALGSTVSKSIDVESLLPDDLGDKFRARMQPEYDKILSTLASGNAEVAAALIATFDKQLAAWASIGQTVTRITGELAGLTGNLDGSVESWAAVQAQMDSAVTRAQAAFDTALSGGNVERIAATAAALHEATLTRLQAELQMIDMVKKLDAATLAASSNLVELVTTIATLSIATSGSLGPLETLLGSLEAMARTGTTTAQRVWAIESGLQAIADVLPGLIQQFAAFTRAADFLAAGPQTAEQLGTIPSGISDAVFTGALPFLTALQDLVDTASGEGKLALLQTQAEQFQSLAAAAVGAINQWAEAAIAGAREAAATALEAARTEAARRIDVAQTEAARRQARIDTARDTTLAAIDAQIEATQELAQLQQEARRAEIDALQELIAKSKEWASAVESMGKFIQSLKVGPLGPGNPADKLRQSQDAFAKALAAYTAAPTAGGLSDLQGLAQTMLGLAEPIFSKPSPQFQALSANTLKQLQAAQALAQAQVTDSKVLQAQLDALLAMDKAATKDAQDQLEALRKNREAVSKDFDRQTKELSEALEQYVGGIEEALKDYETAVEAALKDQVSAIEKAAKDEVTAINTNLIGALNKNAAEQAGLLKEQRDKTDALVAALSSTEFSGVKLGDIATYAAKRQDVAIGILESIRNGISLAVGTPLAQGSARVTEGLYHLHNDEMVIPKAAADRIRSAEMGAGLPDATGQAVAEIIANWDTYSASQQQDIISAYNAADEATQQSAERAASYWQASAAQTARAATRPADLSNTGPWAPGSGDPLRDPWMAHAVQTKAGDWIYEPGYGPGATPGSVVKFGTGPAPGTPPPGTAPTAPYLPPGPPWLYRGAGSTNLAAGGGMPYGGGAPDGGGPITVVVKLDGKTIGEATLPTIQDSARRGTMRTIILETKAR